MRLDDDGVEIVRHCQVCEGILECASIETYDEDCKQGTFKCVECGEEHFSSPNLDGTSRVVNHTTLEDLPKSSDQEKIADLEGELKQLKDLILSRFGGI